MCTEAVYHAFYGQDNQQNINIQMDSGYINEVENVEVTDFLHPEMPTEVKLSIEEEQSLLGQYGPYRLERTEDCYRIVKEGGNTLYCYPIGNGLLFNRYIDEAYLVGTDKEGKKNLFGHMKL